MWASRHKNIRRHFAVTQLSKNRLDKRNQAALSERLGADLRRKGCEVYLNGTRAFREAQKDAKDSLKACTEPRRKASAEQKMPRGKGSIEGKTKNSEYEKRAHP